MHQLCIRILASLHVHLGLCSWAMTTSKRMRADETGFEWERMLQGVEQSLPGEIGEPLVSMSATQRAVLHHCFLLGFSSHRHIYRPVWMPLVHIVPIAVDTDNACCDIIDINDFDGSGIRYARPSDHQ